MGILGKLKNLLSSPASSEDQAVAREIEALKKEGRLHLRQVINSRGTITLTLPGGATGEVRDISFGGLGVQFPNTPSHPVPSGTQEMNAILQLLDRQIDCTVTSVHSVSRGSDGTFIGFRIHHASTATLIPLRELMDPLEWGASLVPVPEAMRNERYQGPDWTYLRGDGPTDLVMHSGLREHELHEAMLTFRIRESYCELTYRNGTLTTNRIIESESRGPLGVGGRSEATNAVDALILRYAACILMNAPASVAREARAFFDITFAALQQRPITGAA